MRRYQRSLGAGMLLALVAVLLAACSGGSKGRTPTPTGGASDSSPAATASSTPETINGVAATPLRAGKPADIPAGVVLYLEGGCTQCDGPATSLDRVYRDAAGTLHSDRLFERKLRVENGTTYEENYIRTMRVSSTGNDIVIGVCDRGYCGGVGNATPDSRTTFYGSNDGGITWKVIGQVAGDTWIVALQGAQAMVRHAYQPEAGAPYRWEIVNLPSGEPAPLDPAIDLKTATIVTVGDATPLAVSPDGMSLLWLPGPVTSPPFLGPQLPVGSQVLDARFSPGGANLGVALVRWQVVGPDRTDRTYLGIMKERTGKPMTVFIDGPQASISSLGQWLAPATLVGNAILPAAALDSPLAVTGSASAPSLTDLTTGEVRAIEPLIERRLKGDRTRILAAAPGPFVKVVGSGDCLNVRDTTTKGGHPIGCYKDGVLLKDRGETRTADGVTWIGVWAPQEGSLFAGWASAEFLEIAGRDTAVKPISHPKGTRTGNAPVDAIIHALETGDKEAISRLVRFQTVGCTNESGFGGPPKCAPGVTAGTPIDAMPTGGCEGSWVLKEDFLSFERLSRFAEGSKGPGLYAVYQRSIPPDQRWPYGEYILVYVSETNFGQLAHTVGVTDGRIVSTWSGCGTKPEEMQATIMGTVVLAPPR